MDSVPVFAFNLILQIIQKEKTYTFKCLKSSIEKTHLSWQWKLSYRNRIPFSNSNTKQNKLI